MQPNIIMCEDSFVWANVGGLRDLVIVMTLLFCGIISVSSTKATDERHYWVNWVRNVETVLLEV